VKFTIQGQLLPKKGANARANSPGFENLVWLRPESAICSEGLSRTIALNKFDGRIINTSDSQDYLERPEIDSSIQLLDQKQHSQSLQIRNS
jgi:hypothetical protein